MQNHRYYYLVLKPYQKLFDISQKHHRKKRTFKNDLFNSEFLIKFQNQLLKGQQYSNSEQLVTKLKKGKIRNTLRAFIHLRDLKRNLAQLGRSEQKSTLRARIQENEHCRKVVVLIVKFEILYKQRSTPKELTNQDYIAAAAARKLIELINLIEKKKKEILFNNIVQSNAFRAQQIHFLDTNSQDSSKIMKLLNKKNLQLNVQGLGYNIMPPQSAFSLSQSQMVKMQQTSQNHNGGQQVSLTASAPLLQGQYPSILQQKLCFKDKMTKVIEGIYVGNYLSAMDQNSLMKENITHIINCSPIDCPNQFEQDITYLNINIQDNWKTNLFLVIYIILDFLRDALQQNGRVLIHCNQGISRSPSIVIAYIIYTEKINANIALEKLKKKYPYADPNLDFQIQLNEMYKEVVEEEEELQRSRLLNSQQSTDVQINQSLNSTNMSSLLNSSHSLSPNQYKTKSLLNRQVMNSSSQITISTPKLPSQKLNYDSYIQMQEKLQHKNKLSNYRTNSPLFGSTNLSPSNPIIVSQNYNSIIHSDNLTLSQTQNKNGRLDIIEENKEKLSSLHSSANQNEYIEEMSNSTTPLTSLQNSPQQFFIRPDITCLKNQSELTLEQKQCLFKRIDSQNTDEEESDIDSPSNGGSKSQESQCFLSQKIQKQEKEIASRSESHNLYITQQNETNLNKSLIENRDQISAQQALQMSSHSQQDNNCDENTEILTKSPSPIKKNNQKNHQGMSIGFDDKDDELKNKMSDSDIDPLDSTDIQDFNTDTSASFSFEVSSSFNNNKSFKQHVVKSSANPSIHTQNSSSLITTHFNGKYEISS